MARRARRARRACSPTATARAPTRSPRSGTRTSTRRGCGRSRRRYRKCVRTFATQLALMERHPELSVRVLAGTAVRLDPRRRAGAVGAHPRARRVRALAARGRHLDRARLQPAGGRVARAPVRPRPALLRARVRAPRDRVLEPRRVRLQRPAPADHARRGHHRLPHPEAVVEPLQPTASTTRSTGSASTARPCSRTSRPPTPTTARRPWPSCAAPRATSRTRSARRAACCRSAGATGAAARRRT